MNDKWGNDGDKKAKQKKIMRWLLAVVLGYFAFEYVFSWFLFPLNSFEKKFAIYDLTEFLNIATDPSYEGADYDFNETAVNIQKDSAKTKYYYADESTIIAPTKQITMPDAEIEFVLKSEDLNTILRHASISI